MRKGCAMPKTLTSLLLAVAAGQPSLSDRPGHPEASRDSVRLPTGALIDPHGFSFDVGSLPLALLRAPEADRVVVLLSGWKEQGIQVVRPATGKILQTLKTPSSFVGAAWAPDHRTLYVSGGNQDVVYRYNWEKGSARLTDSIVLAVKPSGSQR